MKPTKIIYFFQEECSAVVKLKKFLSTQKDIKSLFLKKLPEEDFIENLGIDKNSTVILIDDFAPQAASNDALRNTLLHMSQVWIHHYGMVVLSKTNFVGKHYGQYVYIKFV